MTWPKARLGDLADHRLGKMLDKAKNTGVPRRYLRNPNVKWFDFDLTDLQEILVEEKDVSKYEIRDGDVIVCEGGEAGRAAIWQGNSDGIIFQKACHRVRAGPRLDARFLVHRLFYDYYRGGLDDYYTGATIKHFTGQDLDRYEFPLPPLPEQRRIAAILDKADALCRRRQRAIQLLDGLERSIFFKMFGDGGGHPLAPLSEFVDEQKIGLVRASSELSDDAPVAYVRMDAIGTDGRMHLENVRRTNASTKEVNEFTLKDGDFLFNTRNSKELVGKAAVFRGPEEYIYNNNILRIRLKKTLRPRYLVSYFQTSHAKREIELRKSGTTSVYAIYQRSLESMPVAVPPLADQDRYSDLIGEIEQLRDRMEYHLRLAGDLFSSLQHRAFTGQL